MRQQRRLLVIITDEAGQIKSLQYHDVFNLTGVPLVPRRKIEDGDLHGTMFQRDPGIGRKIGDPSNPQPRTILGSRVSAGLRCGLCEFFGSDYVARPICWAILIPLRNDFDSRLIFIRVRKLLEELSLARIVNHLFPLALVTVDQCLHLRFQVITDAEFVVDDDFTKIIDSTIEFFQPLGRSRKFVRRLDIVHQEPIDVLDASFIIQIGCEQICMPRFGSAVATHIKNPSIFRCDDAKIFALRLGTLADAFRDGTLDLVRPSNSSIPFFNSNREPDGVASLKVAISIVIPVSSPLGLVKWPDQKSFSLFLGETETVHPAQLLLRSRIAGPSLATW